MFYIGIDLGKWRDHTAFVILQRAPAGHRYVYLRGVERLPLGTPYPAVVERLQALVRRLGGKCCIIVDGTGVGAPVVDLIRRARMGCDICEVTITGGEHASSGGSGGRWNVPKQDLVTGLQMMLEQGELRIARKLKEAGQLVKELTDMQATSRKTGRVRLGADGCGQHDDLVMALALACWKVGRGMNGMGEGRVV